MLNLPPENHTTLIPRVETAIREHDHESVLQAMLARCEQSIRALSCNLNRLTVAGSLWADRAPHVQAPHKITLDTLLRQQQMELLRLRQTAEKLRQALGESDLSEFNLLDTLEELDAETGPSSVVWSDRHQCYLVGQNSRVEKISAEWKPLGPFGERQFSRSPILCLLDGVLYCSPVGASTTVYQLDETDGAELGRQDFGLPVTNMARHRDGLLLSIQDREIQLVATDRGLNSIHRFDLDGCAPYLAGYIATTEMPDGTLLALANKNKRQQRLLAFHGDHTDCIPLGMNGLRALHLCAMGERLFLGCESGIVEIDRHGTILAFTLIEDFNCTVLNAVQTGTGPRLFAMDGLNNRIFRSDTGKGEDTP